LGNMPQLGLVSQESVQKERINQNGYAREAFVVVKALPFSLELQAKEFQFSKNTDLEVSLLYITEPPPKSQNEQ